MRLKIEPQGKTVLSILREQHYIEAICNGNKSCGKCKVRLISGSIELTEEERTLLSEAELENGIRLACCMAPTEPCEIELFDDSMEMVVETNIHLAGNDIDSEECMKIDENRELEYGIAIDLGTTTIAIMLIDLKKKKEIKTITDVNRQREYGADVISRMQASCEGKRQQLKELIQNELAEMIEKLLIESEIDLGKVTYIVISGNTVMLHLLQGYPCETLCVAPFKPYELTYQEVPIYDIFDKNLFQINIERTKVILFPGISAFVGADIVSGIYVTELRKRENYSLFIDLGTNGEIVLGNRKNLWATSTAAGPAFEAANISCGVAGIPGAICNVSEGVLETIQNTEPIGLCGTGLISLAYELKKQKVMDENGTLTDAYFETGYPIVKDKIILKQSDIRELQLAKAAIRSGIEILIEKAGILYDDIHTVYVAGGFGYHIDVKKAIGIGIFPDELEDRIYAIGNASLAGAKVFLQRKDLEKEREILERITENTTSINLAENIEFPEKYFEYMQF